MKAIKYFIYTSIAGQLDQSLVRIGLFGVKKEQQILKNSIKEKMFKPSKT